MSCLSLAFLLLAAGLAVATQSFLLGLLGWAVSMATATVGLALGGFSLLRIGPTAGGRAAALLGTLGNLLMLALGSCVALVVTQGFARGRQLRRRGRVVLPRLLDNRAWSSLDEIETGGLAALGPEIRSALAGQWRQNARTEHASVAAFARLSLDLMGLGAPPALIAGANRDALDEIRHAELCFSLARAFDGAPTGPAPFPEPQRVRTLPRLRRLALAKLAVDSLIDGALHEGVSARIAAQLARRGAETQVLALLKEIAADEGRHSAHGWEVVSWCLIEGGAPVAQALRAAAQRIPPVMTWDLPAQAARGDWERWGIPGKALAAREYRVAREQLRLRVARLIDAAPAFSGREARAIEIAPRPLATVTRPEAQETGC